MRKVQESNEFKRDLRRLGIGIYRNLFVRPEGELWQVVRMLANDMSLQVKYKDHPLHGNREGSRDCHIRPDFLC